MNRSARRLGAWLFAVSSLLAAGGASQQVPPVPAAVREGPAAVQIPVQRERLENGLRVVLSPDHSVPTVAIAIYYDVGARVEPVGQTGFAHLFEHLMFEGTEGLPKGEFDRLLSRVGADSKVTETKVRVGRRSGDRIEIVDGLAPDARVVASGGGFLGDGDTVRVVAK